MKFGGNFHLFLSPEKMINSHHLRGRGSNGSSGAYTEARRNKQKPLGLYRATGGLTRGYKGDK